MAWTSPRTWVTSEIVTAAIFNAHLRDNLNAINGHVMKTADQSVTSSAVLANDTHLLYAIPAAGTYYIDLYLQALSAANAAGDLAVAFTFPTGTLYTFVTGADSTLASGHISGAVELRSDVPASGAGLSNFGLSTSGMAITIHALLVATASGTLRLQWSQQVSNASASTLKAGSHMRVRQVA